MIFVCHVILQDHATKASYDFMVWSLSREVATLLILVTIGIVVEDIIVLVCDVISHDQVMQLSCDETVMRLYR